MGIGRLHFIHNFPYLRSDQVERQGVLLLYNFIPLLHLSKCDPQPRPHTIHQRCPIRNSEHQRRRIKEVRVARSLTQPQVVEQRKEQSGVQVNERCHNRIPKI